MAQYIIPLSGDPETFAITLSGVEYQLTVRWNDADQGGWVLDITEPDGGADILLGVPLITGADLLAQHAHLGIGGQLYVWAGDSDAAPDQDTLGDTVKLYFIPEAEA